MFFFVLFVYTLFFLFFFRPLFLVCRLCFLSVEALYFFFCWSTARADNVFCVSSYNNSWQVVVASAFVAALEKAVSRDLYCWVLEKWEHIQSLLPILLSDGGTCGWAAVCTQEEMRAFFWVPWRTSIFFLIYILFFFSYNDWSISYMFYIYIYIDFVAIDGAGSVFAIYMCCVYFSFLSRIGQFFFFLSRGIKTHTRISLSLLFYGTNLICSKSVCTTHFVLWSL